MRLVKMYSPYANSPSQLTRSCTHLASLQLQAWQARCLYARNGIVPKRQRGGLERERKF